MSGSEPADFVRLFDIVAGEDAPSIGAICTAVEREGIYGWDRFGRYCKFVHEAKPAHRATAQGMRELDAAPVFEALAEQHRDNVLFNSRVVAALLKRERPPTSSLEFVAELWAYGWPRSEMPDFSLIEREERGNPRHGLGDRPRPQEIKATNNFHALIGVLLAFIAGTLTGNRHPDWLGKASDYEDHEALRSYLLGEFFNVPRPWPGFSDNHLRTTFDAATRRFEELQKADQVVSR